LNAMPLDWSEQLQAAYPKRSGPSGWKGMRLMLAIRRALFESTWEQIIDGCKNYKAYCQASGREGSDFVQAPQRFIEDGSYLETFTFKAAEDPKITEHKRKEAERRGRAVVSGRALFPPLECDPLESTAAFETRIYLAKSSPARPPINSSIPGAITHGVPDDSEATARLSNRISSLAGRMRIAK